MKKVSNVEEKFSQYQRISKSKYSARILQEETRIEEESEKINPNKFELLEHVLWYHDKNCRTNKLGYQLQSQTLIHHN